MEKQFGLALVVVAFTLYTSTVAEEADVAPHVFISVLVRNRAYLLPNFFGYLENLDYPKDRISVWIRTDHNVDNTVALIEEWCSAAKHVYTSVDCHSSSEWIYPTRDPYEKPNQWYKHVAKLRQKALDTAREAGADYLLSLDVDCFLLNPNTLQQLMEQKKIIVAPMLESSGKSAFSNFWMDQDSNGYYKRNEEYLPIRERKWTGCFRAPVVLSAVLIHLASPHSLGLVYYPPPTEYVGPAEDSLLFAFSTKTQGIGMHVLNTEFFGYIIQSATYDSVEEAASTFLTFKLKTLVNHPPVLTSQFISPPDTPKDNLGLDAVYVINLLRRPERRERMSACLDELNLDYTILDAVDGKQLNASYVEELGIQYMSNWRDPWGNRTMTLGEVGCFLSHYNIWKTVVSEKLDRVLIFEDDADFEPQFRESLAKVLSEAEVFTPNWDLIYVGRKALQADAAEPKVKWSKRLVYPSYSYWLIGYLLSGRGARKLVEADPFHCLLPTDEYVPILDGLHPRKEWAKHYPVQNLDVYSTKPLLVFPRYYSGDKAWHSDTEPPPEILAQIRERKRKESELEKQKEEVDDLRKEEVRKKAVQRQIEQMKKKLSIKAEL